MSTYYIPTYLQVHWLLVHMQVPICRYHNIVTLKYVVYSIRTYVFCGISIFSMYVTICRYMFKCRYIYRLVETPQSPPLCLYILLLQVTIGRQVPTSPTDYVEFFQQVFSARHTIPLSSAIIDFQTCGLVMEYVFKFIDFQMPQ